MQADQHDSNLIDRQPLNTYIQSFLHSYESETGFVKLQNIFHHQNWKNLEPKTIT